MDVLNMFLVLGKQIYLKVYISSPITDLQNFWNGWFLTLPLMALIISIILSDIYTNFDSVNDVILASKILQ